MLKDFRELSKQIGPWAAAVLIFYIWAWHWSVRQHGQASEPGKGELAK